MALYVGVYDFNGVSPFKILGQFIQGDPNLQLSDKYVLWDVRASRIVMAILVGSMLAVSGTSLQGMFKNPLATGDLIESYFRSYLIGGNCNCFRRAF
ncbi:iron chelate uptake ABC transporter family permease subunit [Chryseobacterium indoltheticum]|uniref:iron chelate uptake ABC transporter family permease subunit n=1 Tax=Chryseobacterium indoltheticum TaxID=254 RepID=UPI003F499012